MASLLNSGDLDRPNPMADGALAAHARQLDRYGDEPRRTQRAQEVEALIALLLPSGRATVHTCAASLGRTVRTLQRMLDAENDSSAPCFTARGCSWPAISRQSPDADYRYCAHARLWFDRRLHPLARADFWAAAAQVAQNGRLTGGAVAVLIYKQAAKIVLALTQAQIDTEVREERLVEVKDDAQSLL